MKGTVLNQHDFLYHKSTMHSGHHGMLARYNDYTDEWNEIKPGEAGNAEDIAKPRLAPPPPGSGWEWQLVPDGDDEGQVSEEDAMLHYSLPTGLGTLRCQDSKGTSSRSADQCALSRRLGSLFSKDVAKDDKPFFPTPVDWPEHHPNLRRRRGTVDGSEQEEDQRDDDDSRQDGYGSSQGDEDGNDGSDEPDL